MLWKLLADRACLLGADHIYLLIFPKVVGDILIQEILNVPGILNKLFLTHIQIVFAFELFLVKEIK